MKTKHTSCAVTKEYIFSLSSSNFENRSTQKSTQIGQLKMRITDDDYFSEEDSEAIYAQHSALWVISH